ncbi:saccharopine dehydrogenase family protein [Actinomadura kijaniata]|uniref:saccharopine dehydrogenase family protein n=1 Tax=Actinomadura kijaniata TaxID=46161 RepID=UPI003F1CB967
MTGRVLIIGGHGAVGREAAAALTGRFAVTVAGRHPERAAPVPGATALRLDLGDASALDAALDDAGTVLMCVDRDNARVARACLERGVHYVDVTASHPVVAGIEALEPARATALLSVGLVPGVSNLLARMCADAGADAVDIAVLLGTGERHGAAAVAWTLDAVAGIGPSWRARFPAPHGTRTVHRFPFSDQYTLPRTLGLARARTGLCLDSRALTALLPRARTPLRVPRVRAAAERVLARVHTGGDGFAVTATGGGRSVAFTGRRQSRATGLAAALAVERLPGLPPGVHHIEEVIDPRPYLAALADYGFTLHDHYDAG